jgi:hypothetical protein
LSGSVLVSAECNDFNCIISRAYLTVWSYKLIAFGFRTPLDLHLIRGEEMMEKRKNQVSRNPKMMATTRRKKKRMRRRRW